MVARRANISVVIFLYHNRDESNGNLVDKKYGCSQIAFEPKIPIIQSIDLDTESCMLKN